MNDIRNKRGFEWPRSTLHSEGLKQWNTEQRLAVAGRLYGAFAVQLSVQ